MVKNGLHEYIEHMLRWEQRTYLVGYRGYRKREWSFRDIREHILGLSLHLSESHIGKGDRVVLIGRSSPEWVVAFFAILHRGAIAIPLDPGSSQEFVSGIVQKTSPSLIICDTPWDETSQADTGIRTLSLTSIEEYRSFQPLESPPILPDDIAEIVFTSGTTSNPKGVVLTHRNILSNLKPLEEGIEKRLKLVQFLTPFRLLCSVPFSHMFGQVTGIFLPLLIGSTVHFTHDTGPAALIRAIRRNRILTLIAVPRILKLLAEHVQSELVARGKMDGFKHRWERWVKLPYPIRVLFFLDVHLMLGLHFWSFIVGGAALDPDTHEFWRRLVFSVFQGYGLTESAPMVTMFNPFRHSRTSVGKLFPGQEIRIAPDGEILIRGENVMAGYWDDPDATSAVLKDGWLKTGDIGEIDKQGHVYIKGRKKDMIVTSDGHNVYAEDLEKILNRLEGVREAAVIGLKEGGQERIHAVLLLEQGAVPESIIRRANEQLLPYQKIRGYTVWEETDFPRTPTLKVRKHEILSRVGRHGQGQAPEEARIAQLLSGSQEDDKLLQDLGMSSLDVVETIGEIENKYSISIDETMLGPEVTVGQMRELVAHPQASRPLPMPRWARWKLTRLFRGLVRGLLVFPFFRFFCMVRVFGLENIKGKGKSGILAANHTSDLDPLAVLLSLPYHTRRLVTPAMGLNRFHPYFVRYGHVSVEERTQADRTRTLRHLRQGLYGLAYLIITFLFQTFPFPQGTAYRASFEYIGELLDDDCWILLFPEGTVSVTGHTQPFRGGLAVIAEKTRVPVYPVAIRGMYKVLPPGRKWPRRNRVDVYFGQPILYSKSDNQVSFTEKVEKSVKELLEGKEAR